MTFEMSSRVEIHRDDEGRARSLNHPFQPFREAAHALPSNPRQVAESYLREVFPVFDLDAQVLDSLEEPAESLLRYDEGERLRLEREKRVGNVAVISYAQTIHGLKVLDAIVAVKVNAEDLAVIGSDNGFHYDARVQRIDLAAAPYRPDRITPEILAQQLGVAPTGEEPILNGTSLAIYQFFREGRIPHREGEDTGFEQPPPTLPLPPLDAQFERGQHYIVTKVLFTFSLPRELGLDWTALVEPVSGAVLSLRPHTSGVNGSIFEIDPVTQGCPACMGSTPAATLDLSRTSAPLQGLTPPFAGQPQALNGPFITLVDSPPPSYTPVTEPVGTDFTFTSTSHDFAAVNAYSHCDFLYRYVKGLGIDPATYFSHTKFPVPAAPVALDNAVNAQARGNTAGNGMGMYLFGIVQSGYTVGIASALRVVLHEFGHALLWDHVSSPNFGFAHSAGDSLAAIYADPTSQALDRGLTFPFVRIGRRQDRTVAQGWAWFGPNYNTQYNGEQVLSSTLFRAYQSIGGGAAQLPRKLFASQYMFYLIVQGCGLLTATTTDPVVYVNALQQADMSTSSFQGQTGGTAYKVIRWSFEQQGLFQAAGTPKPYTTPGQPPPTDVYIDGGRGGQYTYTADWWSNQDIWNRLAPDGGTTHQNPNANAVNFAYVRLKNRGTQSALRAKVKGYQGTMGSELNWPADWAAMTTPEVAAAGLIPSGGQVVLGPFQWTPARSGNGSMLMIATADGDQSIVENPVIQANVIPNWRLSPSDNNIGQRNVVIS